MLRVCNCLKRMWLGAEVKTGMSASVGRKVET